MRELPDLVFIDCETTGLEPDEGHGVIEVAAVRIDPKTYQEKDSYEARVTPSFAATRAFEAEAREINKFKAEDWPKNYPFAETVQALTEICTGAKFAGQNPRFDEKFLKKEFARVEAKWPKFASYHLLDVAAMAWPYVAAGLIESVSLKHTAPFFGFGEQTHTAMSDVRQTIGVYTRIMNDNNWLTSRITNLGE